MKQIGLETGICFFRITHSVDLKNFLLKADFSPLPLVGTRPAVEEWLEFGCVYVDGTRQRQSFELRPGQLIRLHTRPKRFKIAGGLVQRIVESNADFLVLDKPAGLPTHPTLDNFLENAKSRLENELQIPLYTTHRLDIPTQGLLIIAKTPDAQRKLNKSFSLGRVEKKYRSINSSRVALGQHTHFMDPQSRIPKQIALTGKENWWRCEMQVDSAEKTARGYWHQITLVTGKTHQIRAQMSQLGAPILGDKVYGASENWREGAIALECYQLSFTLNFKTFSLRRPNSLVED